MEMIEVKEGVSVPEGTMLADGFEYAILGYTQQMNGEIQAVYSYDLCVSVLINDNGWCYDDAIEWMEFNVVSAYIGPQTPIFVHVR